jgi:hypothetical protein
MKGGLDVPKWNFKSDTSSLEGLAVSAGGKPYLSTSSEASLDLTLESEGSTLDSSFFRLFFNKTASRFYTTRFTCLWMACQPARGGQAIQRRASLSPEKASSTGWLHRSKKSFHAARMTILIGTGAVASQYAGKPRLNMLCI